MGDGRLGEVDLSSQVGTLRPRSDHSIGPFSPSQGSNGPGSFLPDFPRTCCQLHTQNYQQGEINKLQGSILGAELTL
jgi:hypothetical protein